VRRRVRSPEYRARRKIRKAGRAVRLENSARSAAAQKELKAFERDYNRAVFGSGGEPSWDAIRAGARRMLGGAAFTVHQSDIKPLPDRERGLLDQSLKGANS
jgi:hypothetical protein